MFKNRKRRAAGSQQGDQLYVSTGQTARDAEKNISRVQQPLQLILLIEQQRLSSYLMKIIDVSLSTSSVNAADILRDGIADVGKSTICNLLKKRYS